MKVIVTTVVEKPPKPHKRKVVEHPVERLWKEPDMVLPDDEPPEVWECNLPLNEVIRLRQERKSKK